MIQLGNLICTSRIPLEEMVKEAVVRFHFDVDRIQGETVKDLYEELYACMMASYRQLYEKTSKRAKRVVTGAEISAIFESSSLYLPLPIVDEFCEKFDVSFSHRMFSKFSIYKKKEDPDFKYLILIPENQSKPSECATIRLHNFNI